MVEDALRDLTLLEPQGRRFAATVVLWLVRFLLLLLEELLVLLVRFQATQEVEESVVRMVLLEIDVADVRVLEVKMRVLLLLLLSGEVQ